MASITYLNLCYDDLVYSSCYQDFVFSNFFLLLFFFFLSSRRRHTRSLCDWSSDVCSSDLGPLERKLAIGAQARLEYLDVAGAVHGLDPEPLVLLQLQGPVHVLAVFLDVARALVDALAGDVRGVDEGVAAVVVDSPPPGLELLANGGEIGQPEDQARAYLLVDVE